MNTQAEKVPCEMLIEFKACVSRALTPHASAILLDPEYGLLAAKQRAKTAGLLLAYEKTGYDKKVPGRLPALLDHWSARRLVAEAGADGINVLLYYSSASAADINDVKQAFIERVGAECAEAEIPFFLELVSYGEGMEAKAAEFARIKPEVVARGMEEFSKPRYRVDVLKVGVPVNMAYVEGSPAAGKEILYSRREAIAHRRRAASFAGVPFISLSEGVSNETFLDALELAIDAGVKFSGVLCGRATWPGGVPAFVRGGAKALEEWLQTDGLKNIKNVNERLAAATPWCSTASEAPLTKVAHHKGGGRL